MPHIARTSLVMYSAKQMYDLVSDVESYPEFLPGCVDCTILRQNTEWVEAKLVLAKGGLRHSFATRNQMTEGQSIEMNLLEGSFKHLKGVWQFHPLGNNGCKVSLNLDFEMKNKIAQMTLGAVFGQLVDKMVEAFAQRAKQVYG